MLLSLALIGGTGCITASIVTQARNDAYRREREKTEQADSQSRITAARADAAGGDPAASVRLALALLRPVAGVAKYDIEQALQLLDQAARQDDGRAQYVLGWIYVAGNGDSLNRDRRLAAPADWKRGVALLKQAAGHACTYTRDANSNRVFDVASDISRLYRQGIDMPQDPAQADLWRARSALHCPRSYPSQPRYITPTMSAAPDALVWARLDPRTEKTRPQIDDLLKIMKPDEIAAAEAQEHRLRQAVTESERLYPAPPSRE